MPKDALTLEAELTALRHQLAGLTEHRSRLMVMLSDRSREIADLSSDCARAKAEGLRHLDEAQNTARQLKRASERLAELNRLYQTSQTECQKLHDELETLRWEVASAKGVSNDATQERRQIAAEIIQLRQELDEAKRKLEANSAAWEEEREQLRLTMSGLSLEIRNEHHAARVLERQWVTDSTQHMTAAVSTAGAGSGTQPQNNFEASRHASMARELTQLREERAQLSARVRELEREAGAALELDKLQQELRAQQVERKLLERRISDAESRMLEHEELKRRFDEHQAQLREMDGLKAEVERLRARLYNTPAGSGTFPIGSRVSAIAAGMAPSHDLVTELEDLAQSFEAKSAVVADGLGFPVATVGGSSDCDHLAAVAGEADRLASHAKQILELAEITRLTLEDRRGTVAHFRYFAVEDNIMSVGTLGTLVPEQADLDRVIGLTRQTLTKPRSSSRGEEQPPAEPHAKIHHSGVMRAIDGSTLIKTGSRH